MKMGQTILHTYPPMKMEQSVPKRRHIKFSHRGITQKKAYSIQNMENFLNKKSGQTVLKRKLKSK